MATSADLSVVVIPLVGDHALSSCLDRLPLSALEAIVVLRRTMQNPSWSRRYPSVKFLVVDEPVPLRRLIGVRNATRPLIAILEDTSWPDKNWHAAVCSALSDLETAAAGGPVTIAGDLASRYQALGWSEYGPYVTRPDTNRQGDWSGQDRSLAVRRTTRLPGNNMAFRRKELLEVIQGDGLFEVPVCVRLRAKGRRIVFEQGMSVIYAVCDRHNAALGTRLNHGRIYAASHLEGRGQFARITHLAKSVLLPFVLTARTISFMSGSNRISLKPPVLFWLFLLHCAWALGEAIGAVAGAGSSLKEWR